MGISSKDLTYWTNVLNIFKSKGLFNIFKDYNTSCHTTLNKWIGANRETLRLYKIYITHGSFKFVIISENSEWVVKIPFPGYENQAEAEIVYYRKAKQKDLDFYFAATSSLTRLANGMCYYFQEKANIDPDSVDSIIYEYASDNFDYCDFEYYCDTLSNKSDREVLFDSYMCRYMDNLGTEEFLEIIFNDAELADFCWDNEINDICNFNIGLVGDHYVIIDYAGYHE